MDSSLHVSGLNQEVEKTEYVEYNLKKLCDSSQQNIQKSSCPEHPKVLNHTPVITAQDTCTISSNENIPQLYLPILSEPGKYIYVSGEPNQIDLLKKSNLDPKVVLGPRIFVPDNSQFVNASDFMPEINLHQKKRGRPPSKKQNFQVGRTTFNVSEKMRVRNFPHPEKNKVNQIHLSNKLNPVVCLGPKIDVKGKFKISDFESSINIERSDECQNDTSLYGYMEKKLRQPKKIIQVESSECSDEVVTCLEWNLQDYEMPLSSKGRRRKFSSRLKDYVKTFKVITAKGEICSVKRKTGKYRKSRQTSEFKTQHYSTQKEHNNLVSNKSKVDSCKRISSVIPTLKEDCIPSRPDQLRSKIIIAKENGYVSMIKCIGQNSTSPAVPGIDDSASQRNVSNSYDPRENSNPPCNFISQKSDELNIERSDEIEIIDECQNDVNLYGYMEKKSRQPKKMIQVESSECSDEDVTCLKLSAQKKHDMQKGKQKQDIPKKDSYIPNSNRHKQTSTTFSKSNLFILNKILKEKKNLDEKSSSSLFVVTPDGTIVEVNEETGMAAIMMATAKLEDLKKTEGSYLENSSEEQKIIKEYVDMFDEMQKCFKFLPDSIQLIESKLPLKEAKNYQVFHGKYLFRQIFKSRDNKIQCLLCKNGTEHLPQTLKKHYRVTHAKRVKMGTAKFDLKTMYVCVPSKVCDETFRWHRCSYCKVTLHSLEQISCHYANSHNKAVKLMSETYTNDMEKFFYCGLCNYASFDFPSHRQHMADQHDMYTYACRFCTFCTPKPAVFTAHVKVDHLLQPITYGLQKSQWQRKDTNIEDKCSQQLYPEDTGFFHCSVCSVFIHGEDRLKQHTMLYHIVQTGPNTWSCAKCLYPYNDMDEMMQHMRRCPKLQKNSDSTIDAFTSKNKCIICDMTFSCEESLKKHVMDVQGINTDVGVSDLERKGNFDPLNVDEATCFLCSRKFPSLEMCRKHQHHMHMVWGKKDRLNDSAKHITLCEDCLKTGEEECNKKETLNEASADQFLSTDKKESDAGKQYRNLGDFDVSIDDLPDDKELSELTFSYKVGHYCYVCNIVIKNYRLYYLHMHNFHQLEKMFKCIITACGKAFSQRSSFQHHSLHHNQMSYQSCAICDLVFVNEEELQDHKKTSFHVGKYIDVAAKVARFDPHNYCCKICHSLFGLHETFVKHMELDSHKYPCPVCHVLFVQPMTRRNHIEYQHERVANICELCGIELPDMQSVRKHLVSHNIVYECPKCCRRFLQKDQVSAHMEVHEYPVQCPWEGCKLNMHSAYQVFEHLKWHRGNNENLKCTFCNKEYFVERDLERHINLYHRKQIVQHNSSEASSDGNPTKVCYPLDSIPPEMIQLACYGCMCTFETMTHFLSHDCPGTAVSDAVGQLVAIPEDEKASEHVPSIQPGVNKTKWFITSGVLVPPKL